LGITAKGNGYVVVRLHVYHVIWPNITRCCATFTLLVRVYGYKRKTQADLFQHMGVNYQHTPGFISTFLVATLKLIREIVLLCFFLLIIFLIIKLN
jgi:hypothetical protein